jgi:hypothetical protein
VRARGTVSAILIAFVLMGTSGCAFFTPSITQKTVDSASGVNATVGAIGVRNALLLTDNNTEASFLVNLYNGSDDGISVTVQYETADQSKVDETVFVNPHAVKSFGGHDAKQLIFNGIDAKPGALFPVFVQYGDVTGQQIMVPVLDGTLEFYSGLMPTPTATDDN